MDISFYTRKGIEREIYAYQQFKEYLQGLIKDGDKPCLCDSLIEWAYELELGTVEFDELQNIEYDLKEYMKTCTTVYSAHAHKEIEGTPITLQPEDSREGYFLWHPDDSQARLNWIDEQIKKLQKKLV